MPRRCCVPGCKSNYLSTKDEGYVTVFHFPKDERSRQQWLKNIPRKDWNPSSNAVVCIKHFTERDILHCVTYTDKNGEVQSYELDRPKLSPGAAPTVFQSLPAYLNIVQPPERRDPEERRAEFLDRHENVVQEWLDADLIKDYAEFLLCYKNRLPGSLNKWSVQESKDLIVFYVLDITSAPCVKTSITIDLGLNVKVYREQVELGNSALSWILPISGRLQRWSQIENILARYISESRDVTCEDTLSNICRQFGHLKSLIENGGSCPKVDTLLFLMEQFHFALGKERLYSTSTIIFSFMAYSLSPACYSALRESHLLMLPHPKHLQRIQSAFMVSPQKQSLNKHYLTLASRQLNEIERFVILQIDEIYVNPGIHFKEGTLFGHADNVPGNAAKTIQAFMVSSAFGRFKEVVALIPVLNQTGESLLELTKNALQLIHGCGLKVMSVISDSNRVNRSMFTSMLRDTTSVSIENPYVERLPLFFFFDTVHIFKNIRNNWLNQFEETLVFPDFETGAPLKAQFSELRSLYRREQGKLVKSAHKLNYKSVYPSRFERQNVNLVCNIFDDTTLAALKLSQGSEGTVKFLEVIAKWWNVVNIKTPMQGIRHRCEDKYPFKDVHDSRLSFLEGFLQWLEVWRNSSFAKFGLTKDTMSSLCHSTKAILKVIRFSLTDLKVNYVLTGKFQTDNLERRFGTYRQLSGGNYNVSVVQILEAEKKIRVKGLLGLRSARYGQINLHSNVLVEDIYHDDGERSDFTPFHPIVSEYDSRTDVDLDVAVYIAGYCAFKATQKLGCQLCSSALSDSESETSAYFDELNRGGLTIPTTIVVDLVRHIHAIMQCLISEKYEALFVSCAAQRDLLIDLAERALFRKVLRTLLIDHCPCGASAQNIFKTLVKCIANILLNNYAKSVNDDLHSKKGSVGAKRKLVILS